MPIQPSPYSCARAGASRVILGKAKQLMGSGEVEFFADTEHINVLAHTFPVCGGH